MIRPVKEDDAKAICDVYNHYVDHTVVTFEERAVSPAEMTDRIHDVANDFPWFVFVSSGAVLGYAYANHWKSRRAYRYSVESAVYLAPDATGRGIGSRLYDELIASLRNKGLHSIIGAIALPNPASVGLHEKLGFEKVAHFKEVGWKLNQWVDVGYWELILRDAEQGASASSLPETAVVG